MPSSLASCPDASRVPSSSFYSPSSYPVEHYIYQGGAHHDVGRFVAIPTYLRCLLVTRNYHSQDAAAGVWCKRRKHWGGWGTSEFRTTSLMIDNPFIRCAKELNYQWHLLAFFLTWWRDKFVWVRQLYFET